ncbi:uncharacterized protein RSE6_04888 [Rhynchosporium secalis]|uniref:Uncharacterized protein n=1 Tax=Rhynchosporium secalis TaxID=38038 RepID=A0A1E1M6F4_RHYSE|nr:uncharacterized protein RSE6_04888 [Rhynchosporium secalis]
MATTIPLRSLKSSFFQMDMQNTIHGSRNEVPPTRKIPIANKDLVFVHLNEITGPTQDIGARHKVRVHVMRDFQRNKHKESKPSKTNKRSSLPNHDVSSKNLANDDIGVANSEKSAREQAILPDEILGNMALSNIHLSGLKIMVDLRGGIYELGLAGVLRRKILWGDLLNATLSDDEPRFNMVWYLRIHIQ